MHRKIRQEQRKRRGSAVLVSTTLSDCDQQIEKFRDPAQQNANLVQ